MDSWSGTALTWDFSLHLSQPHHCLFSWYPMPRTHDWISAAFGTLHRPIKYSTVCSPSPLNQLHAPWISLSYITYMEMWHILHFHVPSNTFSLQQNKEPRRKETTKLFLAVGHELIRPRFVGVLEPRVQHGSTSWHSKCNSLEDRIKKKKKVECMSDADYDLKM